MRSYFDAARAALERHGGTVEKFIGDAVVGMFGVPEAHEDDALRACRAALEIQERIVGELERTRRAGIAVRIGVNTGEVVAGDAARREMFASGDAVVLGDSVNVAARLEQAAAPGEVLIGEATYRLVRDAVTVEPVEPIAAKGKSEPLAAYRLLEASAHGPLPRRAGTPLVGRDDELAAARGRVRRSVGARLPAGDGRRRAGVGKSRLAAELLARIGDAGPGGARRVPLLRRGHHLLGRSRQIVRDLAGIRDDDISAEEAPRARPPPQLAQLLGLAEGTVTADETAGAIAEFLADAAGEQPLVRASSTTCTGPSRRCSTCSRSCPALIGEAPVLLLCLARPELLERAPRLAGHGPASEPLGAGGRRRAARRPRRARGDPRPARARRRREPALRRGARRLGRARAATSTSCRPA